MVDPIITINNPQANKLFGSTAPDYTLSITEPNLHKIWYNLNGGTSSSFVGASGTIDSGLWSLEGNGTVIIRFYVNDTAGNIAWQEVTVRKHIDVPSISIHSPTPNQIFNSTAPGFDVTITDPSGVNTTWYSLNGGTNTIYTGLTGSINQTLWDALPEGEVVMRFYAKDSAGNIGFVDINVYKQLISEVDDDDVGNDEIPEVSPLLIILILAIAAMSFVFVLIKKSKSSRNDIEIKVLKNQREQLLKEAKSAEKSLNFEKATELFGQCKDISNELFKLGMTREAENTKSFTFLKSEAKSNILEFNLNANTCINVLLTKYGDEGGIAYYTEPKIYPDKMISTDGLILNDQQFLQRRLTEFEGSKDLAEELKIEPESIGHIKALQFIFANDLSPNNLVDLCENFETVDVMLLIVGLNWPAYQYEQTIDVPQGTRITYPENISIIDHELFADFVGFTGKDRARFNKLIELHQKMDLPALKKIFDSIKITPHDTEDLKYDLKQKRLIKEDLNEYFYFFQE